MSIVMWDLQSSYSEKDINLCTVMNFVPSKTCVLKMLFLCYKSTKVKEKIWIQEGPHSTSALLECSNISVRIIYDSQLLINYWCCDFIEMTFKFSEADILFQTRERSYLCNKVATRIGYGFMSWMPAEYKILRWCRKNWRYKRKDTI